MPPRLSLFQVTDAPLGGGSFPATSDRRSSSFASSPDFGDAKGYVRRRDRATRRGGAPNPPCIPSGLTGICDGSAWVLR